MQTIHSPSAPVRLTGLFVPRNRNETCLVPISAAVPVEFKCIHAQEKPITGAKWESSFRSIYIHRQYMHDQTPVTLNGVQEALACWEISNHMRRLRKQTASKTLALCMHQNSKPKGLNVCRFSKMHCTATPCSLRWEAKVKVNFSHQRRGHPTKKRVNQQTHRSIDSEDVKITAKTSEFHSRLQLIQDSSPRLLHKMTGRDPKHIVG